jgi:hypothetical protein
MNRMVDDLLILAKAQQPICDGSDRGIIVADRHRLSGARGPRTDAARRRSVSSTRTLSLVIRVQA